MNGETLVVTLKRPTAKLIRDTKLDLWAAWEAENEMPGYPVVYRGFDLMEDAPFAQITIRAAVPRTMKWNG
jgi:hypothetical protein